MRRAIQQRPGPHLVENAEPAIEWRDYARIKPGEYSAHCAWAKRYWDKPYRRWTCLLRFNVLSDDLYRTLARVPLWLNLGDRDRPHASRRGRYFREWIRANGGPPHRCDRLSPDVFTGRMARVLVRDTKGDAPYSVIAKVLSWDTDLPGHSVQQSHSQGRHGEGATE